MFQKPCVVTPNILNELCASILRRSTAKLGEAAVYIQSTMVREISAAEANCPSCRCAFKAGVFGTTEGSFGGKFGGFGGALGNRRGTLLDDNGDNGVGIILKIPYVRTL